MSNLSPSDIQTLLDTGRIVEAGSLLTMHGETLPPEERQALENKRQQLWTRASSIVAEAEILEREGKNSEAQEHYLQAAAIASDFPGIQDHCKRMREALALTSAVRRRSARLKAQADHSPRRGAGRNATGLLVAALLLLALGGGGAWWYLEKTGPRPQAHLPVATTSPPPASAVKEPAPTVAAPLKNDKTDPLTGTGTPVSAPSETQEMPVAALQPSPPSLEAKPPATPLVDQGVPQTDAGTEASTQPDQEPAVATQDQQTTTPAPAVDEPSQERLPEETPGPTPRTPTPTPPEAIAESMTSEPPAPAEALPVPRAQSVETTYTVQPGDTLSEIATRLFCTQKVWHQIHALNQDQVKDPDFLRPGTQIRIEGIKSSCQPQP